MKLFSKAVLTMALLASSLFARQARFEPVAIATGYQFLIPLPTQGLPEGIGMYLKITVDEAGVTTYTVVFLPAGSR